MTDIQALRARFNAADVSAMRQLVHTIQQLNSPEVFTGLLAGWSLDEGGTPVLEGVQEPSPAQLYGFLTLLGSAPEQALLHPSLRPEALSTLNLTDAGLSELPPEICSLPLSSLQLINNPIAPLPASIWQMTGLRLLGLESTGLTGLPPEIGNLTALEVLDVDRNPIGSLPPEIARLTNLRRLEATAIGLTELPAEIGALVNLERLELMDNQLEELPDGLGELVNLEWLVLSNNWLTGLPDALARLPRLEWLFLSHNPIRDRHRLKAILAARPGLNTRF